MCENGCSNGGNNENYYIRQGDIMQSATWVWYLSIGLHHITNQKTATFLHQTD
jgi:hypothetical protein